MDEISETTVRNLCCMFSNIRDSLQLFFFVVTSLNKPLKYYIYGRRQTLDRHI